MTVAELRAKLASSKALGLGSIAVVVPRKSPTRGRRYVRVVPGVRGELVNEGDGYVVAYCRIADLERYLARIERGEL